MLFSTSKPWLAAILGAGLIACSGGEEGSDNILSNAQSKPVFETSFGNFTIPESLYNHTDSTALLFWNYKAQKFFKLDALTADIKVHYFAGIGSDIPYKTNGYYAYDFVALNIMSGPFKDLNVSAGQTQNQIINITSNLNEINEDWADDFHHTERPGLAEIDMPSTKPVFMSLYDTGIDNISNLFGQCEVVARRTRCQFAGKYDNRLPFAIAFDGLVPENAETTSIENRNFIIGQYPDLEARAQQMHEKLERLLSMPI